MGVCVRLMSSPVSVIKMGTSLVDAFLMCAPFINISLKYNWGGDQSEQIMSPRFKLCRYFGHVGSSLFFWRGGGGNLYAQKKKTDQY